MERCNDYWCDYYGKGEEKCAHCEKKERSGDKPDLQVILRRRTDKLMELDATSPKKQGQTR